MTDAPMTPLASAIELAVEAIERGSLQLQSCGNPDPSKRSAALIIQFHGDGALEHRNAAERGLADLLAHAKSLLPRPGEGVRETSARLAWFLAEGLSAESAQHPSNDAHWSHWRTTPDAVWCYTLAEALSSPAPQPQQGCPEGYVLVPVEPSARMVDEGCGEFVRIPAVVDPRPFGLKMRDVYQRMLAAVSHDDPGNDETRAMLSASPSIVGSGGGDHSQVGSRAETRTPSRVSEADCEPHALLRAQLRRPQFFTSSHTGDPDPTKRKATVEFTWVGADALEDSHLMYDALKATFEALK